MGIGFRGDGRGYTAKRLGYRYLAFKMANRFVDSIGGTGYGSFGRSTGKNLIHDLIPSITKITDYLELIPCTTRAL